LPLTAKVRGFGLDHEAHVFGLGNEDQCSLTLDSETCTCWHLCWALLIFEFCMRKLYHGHSFNPKNLQLHSLQDVNSRRR